MRDWSSLQRDNFEMPDTEGVEKLNEKRCPMRIRWTTTVVAVVALVLVAAAAANPGEPVAAEVPSTGDCGPRSIADEFLALDGIVGSTSAAVESLARDYSELPGVLDATIRGEDVQLTIARDAASGAPADVEARLSCLTDSEVDRVKLAVSSIAIAEDEFVAAGYSPHTDRVVVTTNSAQVSVDELSAASGVSADLIIVSVVPTEGGRLTRTSDAAAHKGGAQIQSGGLLP